MLLRLAAWGCVVVIAVLSLLPADDMVRTGENGGLEHAAAYAGTALLLRLAHPGATPWQVTLALSGYAGMLELLQHFAPGRHPGLDGWAASSAGALVGVAAAWGCIRLNKRRVIQP